MSPRISSEKTPTVMVLSSAGDTKTSEYRNSFQERVKAKKVAQMIPGMAIGSRIRVIACKRLQPSIMAHSSISWGTVRKYPMRSQVQNGTRKVGYVTINAHSVSDSPRRFTTVDSGRDSSDGGTG